MKDQENILNKYIKILLGILIFSWLIIFIYYGIYNLFSSIPGKLTSKKTIENINKVLEKIANDDRLDLPLEQKIEIGKNLNKIKTKIAPILNEIEIEK